jgi:uncharacterized membrane protein (DUF373 family)
MKGNKMFKKNVLDHYGFDSKDENQLGQLVPIMEKYKEQFSNEFYDYLGKFKETALLLTGKGSVALQKETIEVWFMEMFDRKHDQKYLKKLRDIGYAYKSVELEGHYVNAAMTFVRHFCHEILDKEIEDQVKRRTARKSLRKILDINLDVISNSYYEAELKHVFVSRKIERGLVNFCEKFSHGMNLVVVVGLVGLSLAVIGLFVKDVVHIFSGNVEHGVIIALGTMLMIWVMIELMSAEIKHIKEGKFSIKVFAELALVAFIRDTLVASLHHDKIDKLVTLAGIVFLLSIVYWIIYRIEKGTDKKS